MNHPNDDGIEDDVEDIPVISTKGGWTAIFLVGIHCGGFEVAVGDISSLLTGRFSYLFFVFLRLDCYSLCFD
jgi:hypothetical protein